MTPTVILQAQIDAYNSQDLDAFHAEGRVALRERFGKTFAEHRQNRAWSVNHIAVGAIVIDQEVGERTPDGDGFEVVAVYTVLHGKIARLAMGR